MPSRRALRREGSATERSSSLRSKRPCASARVNEGRKLFDRLGPLTPDGRGKEAMKPKEAIELAHKNDVKFIDLKSIDFPGVWQHTTLPVSRLDESLFEDGIQFDGSSVRGWQPINASDMTMIPDAESAKLDP